MKSAFGMPTSLIKKRFLFEVGIRNADFGTAKVGIPCADFEFKICLEVGIRDADFGIVEVGIPYADFTVLLLPYKDCRDR